MRDREAEFMPRSSVASELREAAGGGLPSRPEERVGGRVVTQSWTSRETRGFWHRLVVFWVPGGVVMMICGVGE